MNVKIEVITPEIAKEYLQKNTENYRYLNRNRVISYARDIELGKWEFNGESIKFNKSGILVDGQHRLAAIVKANVPVKMLVVYDVDDDVKIYDIAQARTITQIAKASGLGGDVANNSVMSAASILLASDWKTNKIAKGQAINYVAEHAEDFSEAIKISRQGANHGIGKKAACIALIYCMIRLGKYKDTMYQFFGIVNSGFSIEGRDCTPAIVLRNFMISTAFDRMASDQRVKMLFSVTYQALDDFENRKTRKQVYKADYDLADKIKNSVLELDKA
jgi:hypothetical protein